MNDKQQSPQQMETSIDDPSCSYSAYIEKTSPKTERLVSQIWQQQPNRETIQATSNLDDSSTDDYLVQPNINKM